MPSDNTGMSSCHRPTHARRCRRCPHLCLQFAPPATVVVSSPAYAQLHLSHYGLAPPSTPPPRCLCQNTTDTDRVLKSCHRNNTTILVIMAAWSYPTADGDWLVSRYCINSPLKLKFWCLISPHLISSEEFLVCLLQSEHRCITRVRYNIWNSEKVA